ncbi:hypothetical protein JCM10213_003167 [Rhodosporidiobolus nylandii]
MASPSAPPADLSSRPLSSLNDLELATLTSQLKDSQASQRPLVGPLEGIEALEEEYEPGSIYRRKVQRLREDGWTGVRRCRGDGDCFYRAFILSLLLTHVPLHPSYSAALLGKFESLLPLLTACGFEPIVWEDFWEPLRDILRNLAGMGGEGEERLGVEGVVRKMADMETNSCIIVLLRLLTSAYLRTHADEFAPFLFALEDDPRFFNEGAPDVKAFCERYVEPVAQEADNLQIVALTRALQVPVRIAYLDQSGMPAGGFSDGAQDEVEVNFLEFEEEALKRGEKGVEGALLYRPGHYDILTR